jgi:multidrug efflux pump
MSLSSVSVDRPVLATVMSVVIMIFGLISLSRLGVREYPSVDPPLISVTTNYIGAPPEVTEAQITEPLEEKLNAIAGVRTLTSVSREGRSTIIVEFDLGMDLEAAANDVRDRVAQAQRDLPPDADPPIVIKASADQQPVVLLAVSSKTRDLTELSDLADRLFRPALQTIPGVSEVDVWGERRYAMRLWLDRDRLASYGLTPVDVRDALERENVELPSGRLDGSEVELSVRAASRFRTAAEFDDMIVRERDGLVVRLRDVGSAVLGAENERTVLKRNGVPMVGVALRPQPGANQIDLADEFYRRLDILRPDVPPDLELGIGFDTTQYVRASVAEVGETIFVALALVVVIIFAFFRSWQTTLIPALAIPVSLVGGFFVMDMAGFSVNVLTLLAMVLAIGIVVDDAIVVLENIFARIEEGMDARTAASVGTAQVFFAVIATTVALVVVFVPILFLGGAVGRLFREFGVVMAGTIAISAFVSLTLTPMLCARLLRAHSHSAFYERTEPFFVRLNDGYRRSLDVVFGRRWLVVPILVGAAAVSLLCFEGLERELAPLEDRGRIRLTATAPEGASYEFMSRYMDELDAAVMEAVPEADGVFSMTANPFAPTATVNSGTSRLILRDRSERTRAQSEIAAALLARTGELETARVMVVEDPTIAVTGGFRLPLQFVIQARNLEKLRGVLPEFLARADADPTFSRVDVDLKFNKPEVRVEVERERARVLGVSARDVGDTLNLALSEQRFGFFLRDGKQYFVVGALVREDRNTPLDLSGLEVPSSRGRPVRLDNVVTLTERITPPQLFRFNRYASATVSASLRPGVTIGEGIDAMRAIAADVLDDTFKTDLAGEARDFRDSAQSLGFAFVLALVLVYLVLAAQFESFRDPVIILLTVPLAFFGALGLLWVTGQTLNVFSQIGIIMLIGLVTKNGILIVEFANQRKADGRGVLAAAREAAAARFRPVIMTSLSTVLGILPIALALNAGAESRRSMGIAVVGGMVVGTALTLYVIPVVYTWLTGRAPTVAADPASPAAEESVTPPVRRVGVS